MSDDIKGAIDKAEKLLATKQLEMKKLKTTINGLHELMGSTPPYPDEDPIVVAAASARIRRDQFFGKPPITATKDYLEAVREPRSLEQILDGLKEGGFDFDGAGWLANQRLRALAITVSKNSAIFARLNEGYVGLVKWYPELVEKKKAKKSAEAGAPAAEPSPEEDDVEEAVSATSGPKAT
jgi:hypothetical protein